MLSHLCILVKTTVEGRRDSADWAAEDDAGWWFQMPDTKSSLDSCPDGRELVPSRVSADPDALLRPRTKHKGTLEGHATRSRRRCPGLAEAQQHSTSQHQPQTASLHSSHIFQQHSTRSHLTSPRVVRCTHYSSICLPGCLTAALGSTARIPSLSPHTHATLSLAPACTRSSSRRRTITSHSHPRTLPLSRLTNLPTSLSSTSRRVALGRILDNRQNIRPKTPKAHFAPRSWCRAL